MRKHLTIAALFIALLLPSLAKAQVTCDSGNPITVSNADTSTSTINYIPGYSFYNYSFSEVLILSDDLMGIGDIKALQFKPATTTAGDRFTNCEIYLANTELEDLSAGFLNDPTAFELVWSGNMSYTTTDWQTIVFDDAFAWDGTSNIVVAVRRNHGSYSNGSSFASFNAGATLGRYVYQDGGPYTIGSLPSGTGTSNVAWYKLIGCEGSGDVCYRVRDIQVSAITADGCTLTWTDTLNSGASYTIYDMSDTTVLGTSYSTSYTISGLNSNTVYNIAVVAECSSSSSSSFARVSFRTACGGYTAIPFTESFEGLSTGQTPNCWQQLQTGTSSAGTFPSAYYHAPNARNGNLYFEFESTSGQTEVAVLPTMENINTLKLTFWASLMNHNFVLEVGVMEDTVFVPVDTIDNLIVGSNGNWHGSYHEYTVYFSNYSGYGENMAMRVTSSGSYTLMLDDFDVSEDNGCYPLSNLHLEAADSAEITIAWSDEMNSGISYTVTYWKDGGDTTVVYSVSDTAYTASGLDANTNYHFIVTPDCSSGDGEPITASYRTTCGSIAIPFFDNFDSYANGQFPPCWQRIRAHGTDPSVNNQYHHSGSQSMFLLALSDTTLFCTPSTVPLPGNMIKVTYQAYMGYSSYMNYVMWIKAGVMTNPYDLSTFISLDSVGYHNFNNVFEEREFNTSNLDADAEYYVAWMYYSNNNSYRGAVDDVSIVENNGCNKPHDAYIDSVGPYTAHLRWTNGGALASSYTLYYGTQNDITAATAITSVTDTFYTLTGLMPQTTYYAWVITECGGDNSDAKPFGSFTTQLTCAPLTNVTMGDISYTAAVVNWSYNTSVGFPSSEVVITLVDNTDTTIAPVVVSATGTSYTFTGLEAGHGYSVTLRNVCDADGQFDTAANNTVSFMTTSCSEISSDGTTYNYLPTYTFYNYSYTQAIYTAAQMPNIDTILGIAYNVTSASVSGNVRIIDVYMGHTSASTFSSSSSWIPVDSLTLVASGISLDASTTGWKAITFDTVFVYNGNSNVVIAIDDNTGSYKTSPYWACINAAGQGIYAYNDPTNYSPATPPSGTVTGNIPAVRFMADCEVPTCFAPMVTVDATDSASISIHWTVEGIEDSWQVGIKAAGDANYTYDPNPVADTFYTFTGLNAATTYTIIVSSLCIDTLSTTVTAATQCGIVAIPYFTDFEGLSSGQMPICWEQVQAGNSNSGTFPSAYNYSSNAYNGSIYFEFESSSGQTEVAALPAMNNISSLMLSFFASVMNTNFVLEAGVMEGNTFVPVDTVNLIAGSGGNWHGSYYEYEVYFSNYTGTGNRIALRVTGSGSYTLMMDDFTVAVNTGCPRPDQPVVTNVLADQISVSFSGSTTGDYMLYITDGASYVDSASVA